MLLNELINKWGRMESSNPNNKYRIRKSPFGNHHSNNCYRQEFSMAAKTMGKSFMINIKSQSNSLQIT